MNQQDKDLLFKALCGYLPYAIQMILEKSGGIRTLTGLSVDSNNPKSHFNEIRYHFGVINRGSILWNYKPILRPLSDFYGKIIGDIREQLGITHDQTIEFIDFLAEEKDVEELSLGLVEALQRNHVDYLKLIDKGLAVSIHDVNKQVLTPQQITDEMDRCK